MTLRIAKVVKNHRSKKKFLTILWQAGAIFVLAAAIGLFLSHVRVDNRLPLFADRSLTTRLIADSGDDLTISIDEAKALFFSGKAVFLDARCPELFREEHIRGAINLPWEDVDQYFDAVMAGISQDAIIITYCDGEGCDLGEELALELYYRGYRGVQVLADGLCIWEKQNLPVETATDPD